VRTIAQILVLHLVLLPGCYASREPIVPPDAFQQPDVGVDARPRDAARDPDAFAPDAFAPDAVVLPDAWPPELGVDCSLGGTENAFEMSGGHVGTIRLHAALWHIGARNYDPVGGAIGADPGPRVNPTVYGSSSVGNIGQRAAIESQRQLGARAASAAFWTNTFSGIASGVPDPWTLHL